MPEIFSGRVQFRNANGDTLFVIDADSVPTPIVLMDAAGDVLLQITMEAELLVGGGGEDGVISLRLGNSNETIHLSALRATVDAGGNGENGALQTRRADGMLTALMEGAEGRIRLLRDNNTVVHLNALTAEVAIGGNGENSSLTLYRASSPDLFNPSQAAIHADASAGRIDFRDAAGNRTMRLQGDAGNIRAGGAPGVDGDLVLFRSGEDIDINDVSQAAIHANADTSTIDLHDTEGQQTLRLQGNSGNIRAGGSRGADGDLALFRSGLFIDINDVSRAAIHANADTSTIDFRDAAGNRTMRLQGDAGNIRAGGAPNIDGDIALFRGSRFVDINDASQAAIHANADTSTIDFRNSQGITMRLQGDAGNIRAGGAPGVDGDLVLFRQGQNIDINNASQAAIHASADESTIDFRDSQGRITMRIQGDAGNIRAGGAPGVDGDILLFPSGNNIDINDSSQATIHLDGDAGDIILRNADCAEEFDVAPSACAKPGTVMALGDNGRLQPTSRAHETSVVGVVSGAGNYRPGLVLDKQPASPHRSLIALMGKVFVKVTDEAGPIHIGDLLTPSSVEGHAMRVSDPLQAFGAVIGKAIAPHAEGNGLIPMVISLQ